MTAALTYDLRLSCEYYLKRFRHDILLAPRLHPVLPSLGRGVDEGVSDLFRKPDGDRNALFRRLS